MDELSDYLNDLKELDKRRFGVENTLSQILWDGQVENEYFNETFSDIVELIKKCIEDEEFKKQLYEINLDNYISEEE